MKRWHVIAELIQKHGLTRLGAEIGVRNGSFSKYLLSEFRDLSMIGVDHYAAVSHEDTLGHDAYTQGAQDVAMRKMQKNLAPFWSRFIFIRDNSVEAAKLFEHGHLDFVFIDAQHSYEAVRDDILAWRPTIKSGGLLCGHDYDHERERFADVIRAVDLYAGPVNTGRDNVWWRIVP